MLITDSLEKMEFFWIHLLLSLCIFGRTQSTTTQVTTETGTATSTPLTSTYLPTPTANTQHSTSTTSTTSQTTTQHSTATSSATPSTAQQWTTTSSATPSTAQQWTTTSSATPSTAQACTVTASWISHEALEGGKVSNPTAQQTTTASQVTTTEPTTTMHSTTTQQTTTTEPSTTTQQTTTSQQATTTEPTTTTMPSTTTRQTTSWSLTSTTMSSSSAITNPQAMSTSTSATSTATPPTTTMSHTTSATTTIPTTTTRNPTTTPQPSTTTAHQTSSTTTNPWTTTYPTTLAHGFTTCISSNVAAASLMPTTSPTAGTTGSTTAQTTTTSPWWTASTAGDDQTDAGWTKVTTCTTTYSQGQCNSDDFEGISGWFTSPNYPCSNYDNIQSCEYSIKVSPGKYVKLTFVDLSIVEGSDYLFVYDTSSGALLRTMTGYEANTIVIGLSNEMRLLFYSNSITFNWSRWHGWNVTWTESDEPGHLPTTTPCPSSPEPECNDASFEGMTGWLTSPCYPDQYQNNHHCRYNISVPEGLFVTITFIFFDIEGGYDFVYVFDTPTNTMLGSFSGNLLSGMVLNGLSNQTHVIFTTDGSILDNGWNITWTASTEGGHMPYTWEEPVAWGSERLYPWGDIVEDSNILDYRRDHWDMYSCKDVRLNGKVGAPFFNQRFYNIKICDNGMLQLNLDWRLSYPVVFETNSWYDDIAIIAPFWGYSDEYLMQSLKDDFPNVTSRVYYHEYQASFAADAQTRAVIARAQTDVASSGVGVDEFQPSWVLVVTWINIAPYQNWRCRHSNFYAGDNSDDDDYYAYYYYYSYLSQYDYECKFQAEQSAAHLNHFQAVFITDGVYSFVKFNYPEQGINWAIPGITSANSQGEIQQMLGNGYGWFPMAVGGFSSGDYNTGAEVKRGYVAGCNQIQMMDIDNVTGNYPDNRKGEWLFRVEESDGARSASAECDQWLRNQNAEVYNNYIMNNPCPTNLWQAWWDSAFQYHSLLGDNILCYQSVFGSADGLRQRCCYNWDWGSDDFSSLVLGQPFGGHVVDTSDIEDELNGWQACCVEAIGMCGQFYKGRPFSDGENYEAVVLWPWFGDPHIITSDGLPYTFNGLGEYLFTKVGDGDTIIQARTERVEISNGGLGQATYFSAICIQSQGLPKLQVQINKGDLSATTVENQLQLIIDGNMTDINLIEQDSNTTQELVGVTSDILFKRTNASLTVFLTSGISVTIESKTKMLTITLGLPASIKGNTIGLTGIYDDIQSNDFTWPNGTGFISVNSSESDIFDWAKLFAVSESESIMYYTEDNTDWWTYNNNSFVPLFTDNVDNWEWSSDEFKQSAYDVCDVDTACLYDVFVTGDIAVGESSKATAEASSEANALLSNFAPTIRSETSVFITVGQEFNLSGSVNDSNGDAVTVSTSLPDAVVFTSQNEFIITATVTNITNFRFSVTAKDTVGAAASLTPLAMLCSCANNGTCVQLSSEEQADIDQHSVVLDCICPQGYTGSLCESDLDACALVASPCYPGVICKDLPPPAGIDGLDCGDCPAGYTGDGKTCSDIDECALDSCDHICLNSPGSFVCACNTGYEIDSDGSTCNDIDECIRLDPCHHICHNTVGDYACACNDGFDLAADMSNCEPSNPCDQPNPCDDVNGYCNIDNGVEVCSCKKGYTLAADESTCEEIDECALGTDVCTQSCTNTVGGYTCSCTEGYKLADNNIECDDINECFLGNFPCHTSQICSNVPGSFECKCSVGQKLKEGICQVIQFSSPVEPVTEDIEKEVEENSIEFTIESMTIDQYTVEKEILIFTKLANTATDTCMDDSCEIINIRSEATRRRKRSTEITFHQEYFARLPGYPSANTNGGINLAIYCRIPGLGVMSSSNVLAVMKASKAEIKNDLGVSVVEVKAYTSSVSVSPPGSTESDNSVSIFKYAVIGVTVGIVLVIILISVTVLICKQKSSKHKVSEDPSASMKAETGSSHWATPVPMAPMDVSYPTVIPMETVEEIG